MDLGQGRTGNINLRNFFCGFENQSSFRIGCGHYMLGFFSYLTVGINVKSFVDERTVKPIFE